MSALIEVYLRGPEWVCFTCWSSRWYLMDMIEIGLITKLFIDLVFLALAFLPNH